MVEAVQGAMSMASAHRPKSTCEFQVPSRKGDGSDELLSCRRNDHLHFGSALDETSYDEARLVGCNRARNAQYDFLSF